jgi:hypothetical protein
MLHCVALVRTDVSEEGITPIIRVTRIGELGTLSVTSNRITLLVTANVASSLLIFVTLIMDVSCPFEMSVRTGATLRNIPEDGIQDTECLPNNLGTSL